MLTLVYLVRHGMTEWNATGRLAGRLPGVSLNAQGRRESDAVAARLRAEPLRRVIASPLERARETAALIAGRHGLPVETDDAFTEREYTAWQGQFSSEIHARFLRDVRTVAEGGVVPGVEPVEAMGDRMLAGLYQLIGTRPGDAVAIVSHADPIRALIARIAGIPAGYLRAILIDTGSLSRLRRRDGVFVIDYLNSRSHLEDAPAL